MYLYDFCKACYLKRDCRRITGELDNSKMLSDFCFPNQVAKYNVEKANIPLRFQQARIDDFKDNPKLMAHMKDIVSNLLDGESGVSLCLIGEKTGTGKTHCAAAVLNHYLVNTLRRRIEKKEDLFQDYPLVYFIDYALWVDTLRSRYSDEYDSEIVEPAFEVPVLVIDDIGAGKMSDYAREQTFILINTRYSNNLSTIITSNLSLEELSNPTVLGKRTVSRIMDNADIIEFCSTDRRSINNTFYIGSGR